MSRGGSGIVPPVGPVGSALRKAGVALSAAADRIRALPAAAKAAGAGAAVVILVSLIVLAAVRGSGRGPDPAAMGGGGSPVVSSVAAETVRRLKIPYGRSGEGEVPLDRRGKSVYTREDALAVMPELGAVDRTRLTARRKARMDAIFGSVD